LSPGWTDYTKGNYAELPTTSADLETTYTAGNITSVATQDDDRVAQTGYLEYMIHQFKDYVGGATRCTLECELQSTLAPTLSAVYLQIYNHNTDVWDTVDSDNTSSADTDFILTGEKADLTNYKYESAIISCRVYQQAI
jgi:GTPase SAR1 family protein